MEEPLLFRVRPLVVFPNDPAPQSPQSSKEPRKLNREDPWHQRPDIKLTVTLNQLAQRRQARELMARRPRGSLNLA